MTPREWFPPLPLLLALARFIYGRCDSRFKSWVCRLQIRLSSRDFAMDVDAAWAIDLLLDNRAGGGQIQVTSEVTSSAT